MERRNIALERVFNKMNGSDDIDDPVGANSSDEENPVSGKKMTAKEKAFAERDTRRRELNKIVTLLNTKSNNKKVQEKILFTGKKDLLTFLNKFYGPALEEFNY